jgi:hypothetical protein
MPPRKERSTPASFEGLVCFSAREEIPQALKALNEGMKIAERNGDSKMAARFAQEIATVSKAAKPAPPGAAGNTMDQNRLKPCSARPLGLYGELESGSQNGNPGLTV